jgi:hypothetical protein
MVSYTEFFRINSYLGGYTEFFLIRSLKEGKTIAITYFFLVVYIEIFRIINSSVTV